jgi:hypothetical protein
MCLSKTIGVSETYIIGKIYIATGRARAQTRDTHGLVRIRGLAHQVVEVCLAREEDGLPAQLQPVLLPQKKMQLVLRVVLWLKFVHTVIEITDVEELLDLLIRLCILCLEMEIHL